MRYHSFHSERFLNLPYTHSVFSLLRCLCLVITCSLATNAENIKEPLRFDYFEHPKDAETAALLQQRVQIHFEETPLSEVAKTISEKYGIEIQFDTHALKEIGFPLDSPINFQYGFPIRLETVIDHILRPTRLDYGLDHGILEITTRAELETNLYTKYYHLESLSKHPQFSHPRLIKALQGLIDEWTWDYNFGPGAIQPLPQGIVVRQDLRRHRKVAKFLAAYNQLFTRLYNGDPTIPSVISLSPTNDFIEQALQQELGDISFVQTPFNAVISKLEDQIQDSIIIDKRAFDDVGMSPETKVTFSCPAGLSTEFVLARLLDQFNLVYLKNEDHLLITTPEVQERFHKIRFYPLADFDLSTFRSHTLWINMMTNCVEQESWARDEGRGEATIDPATMSLLLKQLPSVHQKVEELIIEIRESNRKALGQKGKNIDLSRLPEMAEGFKSFKRMYVYEVAESKSERLYVKDNTRFEEIKTLFLETNLFSSVESIEMRNGQMAVYVTESNLELIATYLIEHHPKIRLDRDPMQYFCGSVYRGLLGEY